MKWIFRQMSIPMDSARGLEHQKNYLTPCFFYQTQLADLMK